MYLRTKCEVSIVILTSFRHWGKGGGRGGGGGGVIPPLITSKRTPKKPTQIRLGLISDKFEHWDNGFNYFIGYTNSNIIRPLCIILPQMSGYIKYFDSGGQKTSFMNKDCSVLPKCNEIWNSGVFDTIICGDNVANKGAHYIV